MANKSTGKVGNQKFQREMNNWFKSLPASEQRKINNSPPKPRPDSDKARKSGISFKNFGEK